MAQHAPKMLPRPSFPRRHASASLFQTAHHPRTPCTRACQFSTTAHLQARTGTRRRANRDGNPDRGTSAMRHTGLREPLSVSKHPLPKPVLDPDLRDKPRTDEYHGLWGFFNEDRTRLAAPDDDDAYGRAWRVAELRNKSWEDLHSLWWVCALERNRLATQEAERKRLDIGYGIREAEFRMETVEATQAAIKQTLTERWLAWENARLEATEDSTVDLTGDGPAFRPFLQENLQEDNDKRRDPNAPVEI